MHVRQFKEAPATQVGQPPQEDPEWESFTLGRSPTADVSGEQLEDAEETALAQNLEIARGARQRYLIQRWGDGTVCDKTGRRREIEVQFHCSTTTTDTIMFVKETSTCKYALVIHTPRLCGEPGFKSRAEHSEAAPIRCRQIMDDPPPPPADGSLHESAHPGAQIRHQSIAGTKPGSGPKPKAKDSSKKEDPIADKVSLLTKLLDSLKRGASDMDLSLVAVEDNGEQYWVLEGDDDVLTQLTGDLDDRKDEKDSEKQSQKTRRPHQEL